MFRMHSLLLALSATAVMSFSQAACAAGDIDLSELREQLRQLKAQYEQRISALEQRLQQTEAALGRGVETARTQQTAAEPPQPAQFARNAGNAFNPDVSLILNGTYARLSRDPAGYRINGFVPTGGEVAPPDRSFSLGESELVLSANIDPNFRGRLIAAIAPDNSVGVEEGYIETLDLASGLTLKAGRFYSAVGYQNELHAHAWDFVDAPLAYKAFLGNQFADDGVQVKWIAPSDIYLDVGLELGRGRSFPAGSAAGRSHNGAGSSTLFAHVGGDIGDSTAWKVGLSHLRASPQGRSYDDADASGTAVSNAFSGRSRLWALGGVLKWAPNGNSTLTNFKLQGEYFRRREAGSLTYDTAAASLGTQTGSYASRQSGWYVQGVYQFMPQWRLGYRRDRLNSGAGSLGLVDTGALSAANFPILEGYEPTRSTFMVDWSGSEFSRLRLQLAHDRSRNDAADRQLFLQYIMSLGAHGAHAF